jgi:diguanylate cyclase (GGDEF)-like protein
MVIRRATRSSSRWPTFFATASVRLMFQRYGGEEMALILPHTDLEGAHAIAEHVRLAVEDLRVPRLDGQGELRITASVGVAASEEGNTGPLIAAADGALYTPSARARIERFVQGRRQRTWSVPSSLCGYGFA